MVITVGFVRSIPATRQVAWLIRFTVRLADRKSPSLTTGLANIGSFKGITFSASGRNKVVDKRPEIVRLQWSS